MTRLAVLAAAYALVAVLMLPSSLQASAAPAPAAPEATGAEEAPAGEPPAAEPEPAPQPAAAPEPAAAPAPEQAQEPAPPEAAPPEPQLLADERDEQRPAARAARSGTVAISDFQFTPATITIQQGDTVTWTNDGPTPHSATASDGSFDTGIFPAGQSRSHTFAEAGTFAYICTPHPNMRGTVVVNAAQADGDTPTSNDDGADDGGGADATGGGGGESAQTGPALPNSGADSGALLALGALLLLLGAAAHRQLRAQRPRPAGRIGS